MAETIASLKKQVTTLKSQITTLKKEAETEKTKAAALTKSLNESEEKMKKIFLNDLFNWTEFRADPGDTLRYIFGR